jgi:GDP-L-fucose synthase
VAAAYVHVMNLDKANYGQNIKSMLTHINVGSGKDITIREIAEAIGKTIGNIGEINFDTTKPDGIHRKLMDSSRINAFGLNAKVALDVGLKMAYEDFLKNYRN